jgi:lactate 2-monooxygenase
VTARLSPHTRRQFVGSVGSAAVTTVLAPGAIAAARPAPAQAGTAGTPAPPSTYYAYQSEIYLNGMVIDAPPEFTTNLSKLEAQASKVLDRRARRYLLASAGGEATARANARAFRRWRIIPRMFRAHAKRDLSTTILGSRMPAPVILAAVGRQRLAHRDGELASARAAGDLDLTYVQSTEASFSLQEVARANGTGSRWYELDWPRGALDATRLRLARSAGYTHLLLTPPPPGRSWEQLPLIRTSWDGPILLTGIQTVRGAKRAATRGFDGIVVSNQRGRRRDGDIGSVDALPAIVDAVGNRLAVLLESGIRTGTDIFKALALGADAVLVGRPYVYGLALDGQAGVTHVMRTLLAEFDLTVANAGYRTHRALSRASLARVD